MFALTEERDVEGIGNIVRELVLFRRVCSSPGKCEGAWTVGYNLSLRAHSNNGTLCDIVVILQRIYRPVEIVTRQYSRVLGPCFKLIAQLTWEKMR